MEIVTLHIKNMVCPRCIKVVKESLQNLGLEIENIQLGIVTLKPAPAPIHLPDVKAVLENEGFALLEDKHAVIAEKIKTAIIRLIYSGEIEHIHVNISTYLSDSLEKDYHYISMAFSSAEQITVERYLILQKIERVKELLSYKELSLSEIARKLGYCSMSHLSRQFKNIVGCSPSQYRKDDLVGRNYIDQLK